MKEAAFANPGTSATKTPASPAEKSAVKVFVIFNLMLLLGEMGICRTQLRWCVWVEKQLVSPPSLCVSADDWAGHSSHCLQASFYYIDVFEVFSSINLFTLSSALMQKKVNNIK